MIKMKIMKTNASKFTALVVMAAHCYLFYIFASYWLFDKMSKAKISLVLPYVVVHIDLKGAPPKLSYLASLLPILKDQGVNGLLMEYEDMFPYEGAILNVSATNRYGRTELLNFLMQAESSGLDIIPLIQTFGHMEHVLKLKEFLHLREDPVIPDSICPSKPHSRSLISEMITQVIQFHNNVSQLKHIHIGCDEVFHINECHVCRNRSLPKMKLFVDHVKSVSDIVKTVSPDIGILIWDDMLRGVNPSQWKVVEPIPDIQVVYWDYRQHVEVSHYQLLQYHKRFRSTWIASAYKGADGQTATVPDLKIRFLNHFSWLTLIFAYKFGGESHVANFKGIILTGWSRYSHLEPLCELLPASMPSLLLNLILIKKFKTEPIVTKISDSMYDYETVLSKYLNAELNKSLKCDIISMDIDNFDSSTCSFESKELYASLILLSATHKSVISRLFDDANYFISTKYYSRINHINKQLYSRNIEWLNTTFMELDDIEMQIRYHLQRYYEVDVIDEYVDYKLRTVKEYLLELESVLDNYQRHNNVWPRNPPKFSSVAIDTQIRT